MDGVLLGGWTECCSELYNYESCGDNAVLDCSQPPEEDLQPILREEVGIAVASLKGGGLPELVMCRRNLFKLAGDRGRCFGGDLWQDLENRRVAYPMDSVADYYTP